jgi:hypothetical protein
MQGNYIWELLLLEGTSNKVRTRTCAEFGHRGG